MDAKLRLRIHDLMVKARVLEELLISMTKSGDGFFWIGGPGEEAFNVPLGLLVRKGEGPAFDYLHLHYRSSAILLAMGAEMLDSVRQMRSTATDPYSGGRNFANHYSVRAWNVVPMSPTIEVQYSMAPGTAWVQKRAGGSGITIVNGGDAGAAEGDFATCLNWCSRPGRELPVLILVDHNKYGISTPSTEQWHMEDISRRAEPFGIRRAMVDGNDPEVAYEALSQAMAYVRKERKPFCLQGNVSRLNGHSSSSGGGRVEGRDPIPEYEAKLVKEGLLSEAQAKAVWERYRQEGKAALAQAREEPFPPPEDIWRHVYWEGEREGKER
ncbi:MAG: thiamine pyrophosphate-dependent enzyme [Deltaproteobacteria bacterium]